jgi:hypothetical protein
MALTTILPATVNNMNFSKQLTTNFTNGISQGISDIYFPLTMTVPVSPIYVFKLIPTGGFEANQVSETLTFGTTGGGQSAVLNTTVFGTAPDIVSIPYNYNGEDGVLLDCERTICLWDFTAVTTQEFTVTMTGYDFRGVAIQWTSDTVAVGTGAAGLYLDPPISFVTSVVISANPFGGSSPTGGQFNVTCTNTFGLPYFLPNASYLISENWAEAPLSSSSYSVTDYGYNWRQQASSDTYLSARGRVTTGATLPTGANMLVITYYVYGASSELSNEIENKNQSSLKIVGVQKNASSAYPTTTHPLNRPVFVYPYLVSQDLTGVQTNPNVTLANSLGGDSQFLLNYSVLIAA